MTWLKKLLPKRITSTSKKGVPEGIWSKCTNCEAVLYRAELERNVNVCPRCTCHMYISARHRLNHFLDKNHTEELGQAIQIKDRLKFRDSKKYKDRILAAQKTTNEKEAIVTMIGQLFSMPIVAVSFEFKFIGGSMSTGVGERFVLGIEAAMKKRCPVVCFSTSGGARMQEGLFSLFQMARTATVLAHFGELGLPFISVLTNPTMGGVSASLAMLGDIIIAEPNALIGFSGPRVIEQTIRHKLPEGFQKSEFLLEHGAIDMIMDRRQMRRHIAQLLCQLTHQSFPGDLEDL